MSTRKPWWCMTGEEFCSQPLTDTEREVGRVLRYVVLLWLVAALGAFLAERWGWL